MHMLGSRVTQHQRRIRDGTTLRFTTIVAKSPGWTSHLPQWCPRLLQNLQILLHIAGNVET